MAFINEEQVVTYSYSFNLVELKVGDCYTLRVKNLQTGKSETTNALLVMKCKNELKFITVTEHTDYKGHRGLLNLLDFEHVKQYKIGSWTWKDSNYFVWDISIEDVVRGGPDYEKHADAVGYRVIIEPYEKLKG